MTEESTTKRRRPGRPKREGGPKVHKSVRLDQVDLDAAEYFAAAAGIEVSEYIRRAVIWQNRVNAGAARIAVNARRSRDGQE